MYQPGKHCILNKKMQAHCMTGNSPVIAGNALFKDVTDAVDIHYVHK